MTPGRHNLRGRIVAIIVSGVLATSLIFGLATFGITYSMEDRLFEDALTDEIVHQKSSWQRTGTLAAPKNTDVKVYRDYELLPPDMRGEFIENPQQTEYYGRDGRHYHIKHFELGNGDTAADPAPAVAVIEVSRHLFVRPYRDSIIKQLIGISLIVAIFMAVLGWWLVNRAMKPLSNLAQDVASTETDVPSIHAENYPANEIGTLAESLEQAFARIRGFVDRERTFTRDASHELRTPLAVIRGATEVITLTRDLPSGFAEPLRRIETASTDMTLALDQLLALARESDGVAKELVVLQPMIEKAIAWARVRYPGSAIRVSTKVNDGANVLIHPTSLQLVLNNLIGNCFQHVGTGNLLVEFDNDCLSISDDGPGFEADAGSFAPFAKCIGSSGSGLGLDISRRLCDAAGIGLYADSIENRQGAHFRLVFGKA
jgi:signal transduction histidine kinase